MRKSLWLLSAGALALATPALAQDNTPSTGEPGPLQESAEVSAQTEVGPTDELADDTGSPDIIVTAQGRAQVLQDVPLAVSAVSAEALQNTGANDIRALNQLAPSLLVSSTGTESNGSARIRGIGTVGDNPGLESSVAVFIDGVYRSRTGVGLNELGEIERVEVLRGPQGTLFGRNASAGLINIISKKPDMNDSEAYAEATYGNYDFIRVGGGLTGPIGDSGLAYRVDGVYVERDGFYRNVTAAGGTEERVNDRDRVFVRGQLLYEPTDALEIRLIGDYTHRDESCCGAVYVDLREKFDPTPSQPGDFAVAPSNRIVSILQSQGAVFPSAGDPFNRRIAVTPGRTYRNETEDYGVSGQVDYDLGFGGLTSITAYREYKSGSAGDLDYGNVDIFYRAADGNSFRQFKTFSQELRLQGAAFDDRLDWLVGAYYAHEDLRVVDNSRFGTQYGPFAACRAVATLNPTAALRNPANPGCLSPTGRAVLTGAAPGTTPAFGPFTPGIIGMLDRLSTVRDLGDVRSVYDQTSENYAFFTHNIFKVTDQLSLTLGLRYTNENKTLDTEFNNNNTVCPVQQATAASLLTSIATAPGLPAATRAQLSTVVGQITILTCTGNSSSALNALDIRSERDEDELTGTAILSYKPNEDVLVYGSYSKGYKAGGFNLDRSDLGSAVFPRSNADADALQFAAEKVDAYEIGLKYSGRGFTFNVAGFYQLFEDFQLNTFNGTVFIVQNINSCSTDLNGADQDLSAATGGCAPDDSRAGVISKGIELEASIFPARDLAITAGYTYADTSYRDDLIGSSEGEALDPFLFLLPGQQLSNAPEHVVTASLGYTPDIGNSGLSGLFYVDTRLTSDFNTGSDLFPEKEQDGFALVNARIGLRGPDQRWALELWAQNLFDTNYQQVAFNAPFQGADSLAHVQQFGSPSKAVANQIFSSFLAEPRTYGVTLRTRF